jgi:hypothetical protein
MNIYNIHLDPITLQLILYNLSSIVCFILIGLSTFNISNTHNILINLEFYIKIYISLFLLWRFNMFRKDIHITELDKQLAFSCAFYLLSVTILNKIFMKYKEKAKIYLQKNNI